jgi:hypothetical protein
MSCFMAIIKMPIYSKFSDSIAETKEYSLGRAEPLEYNPDNPRLNFASMDNKLPFLTDQNTFMDS